MVARRITITPEIDADIALVHQLDDEAKRHDTAAAKSRDDRRKVLLRLYDRGMTYEHLAAVTGLGTTTLHAELRRARTEIAEVV